VRCKAKVPGCANSHNSSIIGVKFGNPGCASAHPQDQLAPPLTPPVADGRIIPTNNEDLKSPSVEET